ncbi:class I SAM-dependent methyltransferase [Pseudonocardia sp.]|uniref:class I SAM-dependent methyltransferase n=1 Tax=Pseudonocardia sp. TaxID=60912 RepID=UPI0026391A19|nr:class I SAM-dependent methyltransferase [Pseudonocardia sp.]
MTVDQAKLEESLFATVGDLGAATSMAAALVGHKTGLYQAMAGSGPMTSEQLAQATGTRERYVREWLNNQAAGGYVDHDPLAGSYTLPDERAMILADPDSPVYLAGGFDMLAAIWSSVDRIEEAFGTGEGVGWHEHHPRLFSGTEAFFRPGYRAHLVSEWIPALDGVEQKLVDGARVADVGCGHGASTILMARAYPNSTFTGVDYHEPSIGAARTAAADAGIADRATFEVADAAGLPGGPYDLVCFFDALHDLGDPVGAARQARQALAAEGTVMLVEPAAGDQVQDNLNPVGRLYYGASIFLCTPNSLSQDVGLGLGAQAGEARLNEVMGEAGFSRFRRAAETPVNMVLEARP